MGSQYAAKLSLDGIGPGLRALGIILRIQTRHAVASDDLAVEYDRKTPFLQIDFGHSEIPRSRAALSNNILQHLRRSAKLDCGATLAIGDAY
jgi:hypothetical protein